MRVPILIFSVCALSNSIYATAATNLTSYVVKSGVLTFSLKETKASIPDCVTFRQQQMWAIKLGTPAGDRMARQLKEAVLNQQTVEVTSAKDCADKAGFERPLSLMLSDNATLGRPKG